MPAIEMHVDFSAVTAMLDDLRREQVPFAASKAINDLARELQDEVRARMFGRMTIRRDWVTRYGIKIPRFAKKRDRPMTVSVLIPPTHDFLWKFETGEAKAPKRGRNLAIPIDARSSRFDVAPAFLRPKRLGLTATTTRSGKPQVKGDYRTFVLDRGVSTPGIYQRTGPRRSDIRLLYALQPTAPTPPVLEFYATARRLVRDRWADIRDAAFRTAFRTAKRRTR